MAARNRSDAARGRKPLVYQGEELRCTLALRGGGAARTATRVVAGVDEVGRGALCGPVVAGAVVLGDGLRRRRDRRLQAPHRAPARGAGRAHPREGARACGRRAAPSRGRSTASTSCARPTWPCSARRRRRSACRPTSSWSTPSPCPAWPLPQRPIVKGDALSVSIAAASIVAKVARDAYDARVGPRAIPATGWRTTWDTPATTTGEALRRLGPSEIHRRSFHGTQRWLF